MFARWRSPEATFQILRQLSRGMPCDMTGIRDYQMLEQAGGIQWPFGKRELLESERRLFGDGKFFTPDQRARFLFSHPEPPPESTSTDFPFILLTGRGSSAQWHTGTRTNKSDVLRVLAPTECYVEINPSDARTLAIAPGDAVEIASARASITARAFITPTVAPGHVFIPMHYPAVNTLTHPTFDPHSRQPSYKYCAVRLSLRSRTPP